MAPKVYHPLFVFVSSDQRIYALRSPLQICRRLGLMKNVNRSTPAPSIDQIIRVVVKNGLFPVKMTVRVDPPPPYGQLFVIFLGVNLTLEYDYICSETNFT